ncbi:beclin-1-like [Meleagris gallopavo]|uniref:beclin-1-like n=1 Tax=Meleagris gallopavo TaxID=9103 RepID=UPI000549C888|nr:beclin-1-like [Meleagris gallopavo]
MEGGRAPACTTQVSFVCQRCSQPLKLDTSFKILDRLTIQELTAPLLTAAPARPGDAQEESALSEVRGGSGWGAAAPRTPLTRPRRSLQPRDGTRQGPGLYCSSYSGRKKGMKECSCLAGALLSLCSSL